MDYIGRTMNICLILFMIFATGSHCQYYNNRDIILTPNHLKTYPGKVLYYRPRDQGTPTDVNPNTTGGSTAVPWEEVLKETVFLALNDNKTSLQQQTSGSTDNASLRATRQQKAIYNAPYIGAVDLSAPRFGDIVELARGSLEHDGEESYYFVQQHSGNSSEQLQRNVTALWKVERIRHRDDLRGHRFELKFTVAPTKSQKAHTAEDVSTLEGEPAGLGNRTFIVRDEDYPKYFAPLISPNVIPLLRKNDQLYDRTFFDLVQPQMHQQYGGFAPANRFYRPAVVPQQQTITLGQYLMQSLLSGGEAPKYHHHHHHFMPGKLVSPGFFGGFAATANRIKFPDSFTGSSHTVPKFYQHIHFQRPSIAPLAPTALPGSYLIHHHKDVHAPAPSNIHQDYTKWVDLRGATTPSMDPVDAKPANNGGVTVPQKAQSPAQNQIQQTTPPQKAQQKPSPIPNQQQQQQHQHQFHQVATTPNGIGQQTPNPPAQQNSHPQQFSAQQHAFYRPQVPPQHQQPILIHPHAHPQLAAAGGPAQFISSFAGPGQSHLIQSIPFYNPHGQMVLNHIPIMSNHHVIQMSPQQPIAIPVHVQLIPPVAQGAQLYAPQQQQQPLQQHQQPLQQHQQQDGPIQAIPVRIMQPVPNPVHLYSPVNPFLPPLQAQQQQFHHHGHQHHPVVTVTPKTTSNYQHHQLHPRPAHASHAPNNQSVATPPTTGHQTHPPSHHPHSHLHTYPHTAHSFNAIPTVFKFTSSNAIHPQKANAGAGAGTGGSGGSSTASGALPTSSPTPSSHHTPKHRYNTPNVQISGPSISPTPPAVHQRHRFSTSGTGGVRSSSTAGSSPPPTSATRPSARYTPAVGQVSGPTVSSTAANHRYAPLPTVPASPAGLREKFTPPAFQPAASESKPFPRKLEPPTNVADAVGSPSNAVSPKYESFGVENAVTPTAESLLLQSPASTSPAVAASSLSSLSHNHHPEIASITASATATASPSASRTTLSGGAFSYSNFIDASGAVSVTAKLTSEQTSPSQQQHYRSSTTSHAASATTPVKTTQATIIPHQKTYIQQLGPTIGVKYPPAFKSMPSVTIVPPQIETPISSTLKTYQYLNHHDTYDFIPSRVVELAHVKKMNGQKHPKRNKQNKGHPQKAPQKPGATSGGMGVMAAAGPATSHHHHVTVTSNKPLRFYPGDGPEYATHRPEAQLSVQLPPPEKDFMTYYGTPKHNQKVQRPKNFVTPLHPYQGTSTTPLPATLTTSSSSSFAFSTSAPGSSAMASTLSSSAQDFSRNITTSTFRSATASSTAHYYKNRHEKSDDLSITTMRPRMILKTIYRQFPGSFASTSTSTSTEKPLQKWVPKRPRVGTKSTSGEFSTSTLPSSSLPGSLEQVVASSERDVVTKTPVVPVVSARSTLDQQMQRMRASRGRSRYTYRRIPSGNPPPIPTSQQQPQPLTARGSRMRNSNFNTSTTTIKPIPGVTSSVFDSNRIDGRSFEQQERKAEETVMATAPKNGPNEKIKRDASEETTKREKEDLVGNAAVAEQWIAQQVESKQNPLEVTEPEKEYVMVKASIAPVVTNHSNVMFFEASDTATKDQEQSGRSSGSTFDDLTMSIINHAKAIVNQTESPVESVEDTTPTTPTVGGGKKIESNEIVHKELEPESTVEARTTPISSTSSPATESTVSDGIATTTNREDDEEDVSQTTVVAHDV